MREKNDILQSEIDYFKEEYKKMRYFNQFLMKQFMIEKLCQLSNLSSTSKRYALSFTNQHNSVFFQLCADEQCADQ